MTGLHESTSESGQIPRVDGSTFAGDMSVDGRYARRALSARDSRFDGVFFIGVTTTRIYCRPVCPSRTARDDNRRVFDSAAAAEIAGFRPCLRCRPELAPGRALCDAVSRLASSAVHRISSGALNGRSVAELARELEVSERHLRRALEREIGVSPLELAQTHRLLLAKRLLADTALSVTDIAYASGFQSLRRFNAVFRERYGMSPSAIRRRSLGARRDARAKDLVRLTLAYRPPMAWDTLLSMLHAEAIAGVETVGEGRYARTVRIDGKSGVVLAEDGGGGVVNIDVSMSLVPVLMPLLVRLRHLFDLDAEPRIIDACLAQGELRTLVEGRPGLRIVGAFDGFELVMRVLAGNRMRGIVEALGASLETEIPSLDRLAPDADRIAECGAAELTSLGVPRRRAESLVTLARLVADGKLRLEPGSDVDAARDALTSIGGLGDHAVTMIVMRALRWPDAFPSGDPELHARSEQWRPWRAYAAMHLWLARRDSVSC